MKKTIIYIAFFLFTGIAATAQAPQEFNYQGVARNTLGVPLAGIPIGLRLTVHDGSPSGTVVYQETHVPNTNAFGLYNVAIGNGTVVSGVFTGINWGSGSKYLQVEIDPAGGAVYTDAGTSQLLSVPYAVYADKAASAASLAGTVIMGGDLTGTNSVSSVVKLQGNPVSASTPVSGQVLSWNSGSGSWVPTTIPAGGSVTSITAGSGLSGGVITTSGTISMPNIGTAGTYGSATQVPVITTDAQGRVSSVTNTLITGDDWGSQVAHTDATLAGNGTTGTPLKIAQQGAITGQALEWSGTSWVPATIPSATTYAAGTGLSLAGTTFNAQTTTALWNANELQGKSISSAAPTTGQVLSWSGTAWTPATATGTGTVTSVTAGAGLSGGTITTSGTISMPGVGTAGTYGSATQVPVFTTDAQGRVTGVTNTTIAGGTTYTAGTGLSLTGTVFSAQNTSALWNANQLQGKSISATAPTTGQVLTYNSGSSTWVPTTPLTGGTVTSVTAGAGLSGGTITTSGTISLPNVGIAGTYGSATQVPVITTDAQGRISSVSNTTIAVPSVAGTTNYISKFTSATALGNSEIFDNSTSVGVGTATPSANNKMEVLNTSITSGAHAVQGTAGAPAALSIPTPSGIYGTSNAGVGVAGISSSNSGVYGLTNTGFAGVSGVNTGTTGGYGVYGSVSGTGIAGYFDGGSNGYGVIAPNGSSSFGTATIAATNQVQVLNTSGALSSHAVHATAVGPATTSILNVTAIYGESNSGIGVAGVSSSQHGTYGLSSASGFAGVAGSNSTTGGYGIYGNVTAGGIAGGFDGGTSGYGVVVTNGNSGFGTVAPGAKLHISGSKDQTITIAGFSYYHQALLAQTSTVTTSVIANAIVGDAANSSVENHGVYGRGHGGAGAFNVGVLGSSIAATTGNNFGVYGEANNGALNYGVYGTNYASAGYAGYFQGNVQVTGTLSKGSGTFKIDHPLDPENKYLYHSFVESPDMMNVYNGNVVTDASGTATVSLPDYFDALNKDFRYQLTTIGQPAQVYISREINGNQFEIKSDKPNVKVSWLVTGVRQDKFANAHRVVPEVEKETEYKGRYLHAREWGMPDSKSIDALTRPRSASVNNSQANTNEHK